MDPLFSTPFVEMFRRGEAEPDVRLQAARGLLAPRATEQLALLVALTDDGDAEVTKAAEATLAAVPVERIAGLLSRTDAPADLKTFFAARGIEPAASAPSDDGDPLVDASPEPSPVLDAGDL